MTAIQEQLHELVEAKLRELRRAIYELQQHTVPYTPLPRPKVFKLFDDGNVQIIWPSRLSNLSDGLYTIRIGDYEYSFQYSVEIYPVRKICEACGYQPAKILKVIRRIDAAIEWCKRRTEGRKRAAEEILKQQTKAIDILNAISVAYKLSKTP